MLTVQGIFASLSPAVGGWIAHFTGYQTAFLVLGGFGVIAAAVWVMSAAEMKKY